MRRIHFLLYILIVPFIFSACEEPVYTPKPRGFPKVAFPERSYQQFDKGFCEFSFEYPQYAEIIKDTLFFKEKPANDCWFDLSVPAFGSKVHFTYYPIQTPEDFEKLRGDAFKLAGQHNKKADYIDELPIQKANGVSGFIFDIEGEVASPFQFYLTDSTQHFLRGSLYFDTETKPDSLAPIYNFIKEDILHLVNTFEWQ